jgi:hypothetical protein
MEKFIDKLIRQFESGALGRREFCQMMGIATAIYAAGGPEANAAPAGRGFKALGINHVSYMCPDYTKARDFYSSMFGMRVTNDKGRAAAKSRVRSRAGQGRQFRRCAQSRRQSAQADASRHRPRLLHNFELGRRKSALR